MQEQSQLRLQIKPFEDYERLCDWFQDIMKTVPGYSQDEEFKSFVQRISNELDRYQSAQQRQKREKMYLKKSLEFVTEQYDYTRDEKQKEAQHSKHQSTQFARKYLYKINDIGGKNRKELQRKLQSEVEQTKKQCEIKVQKTQKQWEKYTSDLKAYYQKQNNQLKQQIQTLNAQIQKQRAQCQNLNDQTKQLLQQIQTLKSQVQKWDSDKIYTDIINSPNFQKLKNLEQENQYLTIQLQNYKKKVDETKEMFRPPANGSQELQKSADSYGKDQTKPQDSTHSYQVNNATEEYYSVVYQSSRSKKLSPP